MSEIYSKSPVRAIGKVLLMRLSYNTQESDEKWPLLFWRSASITLDNNNNVFFSSYTLPHTSVGLTDCISIVFFHF